MFDYKFMITKKQQQEEKKWNINLNSFRYTFANLCLRFEKNFFSDL